MFECSASLASLTRETGPKLVKGDPTKKTADGTKPVIHSPHPHLHHHPHITPTITVSDSSLKFTHVLYNLSPAGGYFCHLKLFFQTHIFSLIYV